jgi:acyl carrier protein
MKFELFKQMVSDGLGIDETILNREVSFRDDLGIDSLSVINFLLKVERNFKIKIDIESIGRLKNLGELYDQFCLALEGGRYAD